MLSDMKEFNARHVQHHLADLLEAVERGEKFRITRRGKVVACLGPPEPAAELNWPNSAARFQQFPQQVRDGAPASRIIDEDRQERL